MHCASQLSGWGLLGHVSIGMLNHLCVQTALYIPWYLHLCTAVSFALYSGWICGLIECFGLVPLFTHS